MEQNETQTSSDIQVQYICRHCSRWFDTLEEAELHVRTCRLLHEMTLYQLRFVWKFRPDEAPFLRVKKVSFSLDQYETLLGKVDSYIYHGEFNCTLHTTDDSPETISQFKEFCRTEMKRLLDERMALVYSADFSWIPVSRI